MRARIVLFLLTVAPFACAGPNPATRYEAERYTSSRGAVRRESQSNASGGQGIHIGPDSPDLAAGVGDMLAYEITVAPAMEHAVLELTYADDDPGNLLTVSCDGALKGRIRTERTGGWNQFAVDTQKVELGMLSEGRHTVQLAIARGGSYGVLLDAFNLVNIPAPVARGTRAYAYVKDLVRPETGLVASTLYDDPPQTTLYKVSLAAMAFLHEGDRALAERQFDFFLSRYRADGFDGFNKSWNAQTGNEGNERDHWVGDNAFLLLALNYYKERTGGHGRFQPMVDGLVRWLVAQADQDTIAEGYANMFAALKPFESSVAGMPVVLTKLRDGFFATKDYGNVLDHTERGALVFSDLSGFGSLSRFRRTERWDYNATTVTSLAAGTGQEFGNVEITAQILLAERIWRSELSLDLSDLSSGINQIWLATGRAPGIVNNGLPYYPTTHDWEASADEPIVDPTCYMLFHEWSFNPMAPGRKGY